MGVNLKCVVEGPLVPPLAHASGYDFPLRGNAQHQNLAALATTCHQKEKVADALDNWDYSDSQSLSSLGVSPWFVARGIVAFV